jgi:hypothetical protein
MSYVPVWFKPRTAKRTKPPSGKPGVAFANAVAIQIARIGRTTAREESASVTVGSITATFSLTLGVDQVQRIASTASTTMAIMSLEIADGRRKANRREIDETAHRRALSKRARRRGSPADIHIIPLDVIRSAIGFLVGVDL